MAAPELAAQRAAVVAAAFLAFSFPSTANAHEHHMDSIEEGHAISDDPIVRQGENERVAARERMNADEPIRTRYYGCTF